MTNNKTANSRGKNVVDEKKTETADGVTRRDWRAVLCCSGDGLLGKKLFVYFFFYTFTKETTDGQA